MFQTWSKVNLVKLDYELYHETQHPNMTLALQLSKLKSIFEKRQTCHDQEDQKFQKTSDPIQLFWWKIQFELFDLEF